MSQTLDDLVLGLKPEHAYDRLIAYANGGSLDNNISKVIKSKAFKEIYFKSDQELSTMIGETVNPALKVSTSYNIASIVRCSSDNSKDIFVESSINEKISNKKYYETCNTKEDENINTSGNKNIYTAMTIDRRTALVITDPQRDFLDPEGLAWGIVGDSVIKNNTTENLLKLLKAATNNKIPIFVSPHFNYKSDNNWNFSGPVEKLMQENQMCSVNSSLDHSNFNNSGADFMPVLKPYIINGYTTVVSPHKLYGPSSNDLCFQLRKRGINKIILAGMSANLCLESHLRELLENGFEVGIVSDSTAGAKIPGKNGIYLDGYQSALTNFHFMANTVWTTDEVINDMNK